MSGCSRSEGLSERAGNRMQCSSFVVQPTSEGEAGPHVSSTSGTPPAVNTMTMSRTLPLRDPSTFSGGSRRMRAAHQNVVWGIPGKVVASNLALRYKRGCVSAMTEQLSSPTQHHINQGSAIPKNSAETSQQTQTRRLFGIEKLFLNSFSFSFLGWFYILFPPHHQVYVLPLF